VHHRGRWDPDREHPLSTAPRRLPPPLPTVEVGWPDLLAHPAVTETVVLGGGVGVLAYHAGLEAGTWEVAAEVAERSGSSLYALRQPPELRWHVPSSAVDPSGAPGLARVLGRVRLALSVHGYGRRSRPWEILLGGQNRQLAGEVADELRLGVADVVVVDDLAAMPPALRGLHPTNPVNRPPGQGVQIELPIRVRLSPDHRTEVAAALARVAARHGGAQTSNVPPARK
jgi:phage replication-related protein YjqB (UPF0714/DUF867 family)